MVANAVLWSIPAGIVHFIILGALYGNPVVDRIFRAAQDNEPGVRKWESKPRYLMTQFLGTQMEVFILVFSYVWLRPHIPAAAWPPVVVLGLTFAAIRVYPRFWNMWIQTTYPKSLLGIEALNGTIGTFIIIGVAEWFAR